MDQTPKSTDRGRIDHNNNNTSSGSSIATTEAEATTNACSCSNISIMQLFHEMKQEFPKVPDHIVQQLATENCHNRIACIEQLSQAATTTTPSPTMYPSKAIHSTQTTRSPVNGTKWANNKKMREISEMFENSSSISSNTSDASTSSDGKVKRPTTLALRRAPEPPSGSLKSTPSSNSNSITNLSRLTSNASSTSSSSTTNPYQQQQQQIVDQLSNQFHHNVTLDSTAAKFNDSLNVQLNVTVSPISSNAPPIPPRPPLRPVRHTSQLSVQPEPAFTSMLDPKKSPMSTGSTSAATGSLGQQRSYTSVNFTLRQPTSILPSPQTPIEIQAGPSSLTYSSSSFNAKQGYQSHLKITVAGNGESCIQAVRTKQSPQLMMDQLKQIDTTISIAGNGDRYDKQQQPPIRIVSNNQKKTLPMNYMTEGKRRFLLHNHSFKCRKLIRLLFPSLQMNSIN